MLKSYNNKKLTSLFRKADTIGDNKAGFFWNTLGSCMTAANSVLLMLAVSRTASLGTVGEFSLALTTSQMLYVVALFGINDFQMTDFNHEYSFRCYSKAKFISSILAVACCVLVILLFGFSGEKAWLTLLMTAFMLVNSVGELFQSLYFQNSRVDLAGKSLFFRYLISTVAFCVAVFSGVDLLIACLLMIIANMIATWFWCIRIYPMFVNDPKEASEDVKQLLKWNFPLFLSVLGSLIVINAPKYIINFVASDEIQGIFGILYMPTSVINLVGLFIYKPCLEQYAAAIRAEDGSFQKLLSSHSILICAFSVFCAILMLLLGPFILQLLFGLDLGIYRMEMALFMLAGGMMAMNQLLYYLLVILRKQKQILCCYGIAMIAAIIPGLWAIPRYGVRGALLSFAGAQLLLLLTYGAVLLRERNDS